MKSPVPPRKLDVLEQQYPGESEPSEEEVERRGIPDGWIYSEDEAWCVFIETKVLINLRGEQIERHRRTAERRGFRTITALSIIPHQSNSPAEAGTVRLEWRNIYKWLRFHQEESAWASYAAAYLEIAEAKLIGSAQFVEGTLTMFTGFPFGHDHPYTYLEGKRLLGLALNEFRARSAILSLVGSAPLGSSLSSCHIMSAVAAVGLWVTLLRYPHVHSFLSRRSQARRPATPSSAYGTPVPGAGAVRCKKRSTRRCRRAPRGHRRSP